ncbi:MAG: orotidine-5'-phosphate decarboxylase [Desulfobacterales bacterium]|nr:MAG: orotidine-5'-phosphate decarboxylase [Desulfobacterales bacterium]
MKKPKDCIIFPLDVASTDEAKRLVELLADYVGLFKVGLELFIRSGPDIVRLINDRGAAGVFLDLKLHDIPATVSRAMSGIADLGVRFATVHCGEAPKMLEAAVIGGRGAVDILGVTVLTSVAADDIRLAGYRSDFYPDLTGLVMKRAAMAKTAGCAGVVCSGHEAAMIKREFGKKFVTVTPGIRPQWSLGGQDDQQRITTPAQAIRNGSDYLVIGRPIRDADDPAQAAVKVAAEIEAVIAANAE